jgi:hypothetical protein
MSAALTSFPGFTTDPSPTGRRRQRSRDANWALPHRHAWPAPLTNAEAAILRRLPSDIRRRPISDFVTSSNHRVHLGRLQNRRIGVLTVGDCADAEIARELSTWAGLGPTLAHWFRATLLRLSSGRDTTPLPFPLHQTPQP